jgi:hypothetical protein
MQPPARPGKLETAVRYTTVRRHLAVSASATDPTLWPRVLVEECEQLDGPMDPRERGRMLEADASTLNRAVFDRGHSALCLSGGGIRSATFAVGVLQALARLGVLLQFDYLSTVSGGGFAGGWLTAWLRRAQDDPVTRRELDQLITGHRAADDVEPDPLIRLRSYSRYMSPRAGLFSADAWTLGATMLRNLLLNWLVLLPLISAVLLLPRLHYSLIHLSDRNFEPGHRFALGNAETWILLVAMIANAISLAFTVSDLPSYGNARRTQRQFLLWCLMPLSVGTLALTYFWAVDRVPLTVRMIAMVAAAGQAAIWAGIGLLAGGRPFRPRTWVAAAVSAPIASVGMYLIAQRFFHDGVELHRMYVSISFPVILISVLAGVVVFIGVAGEELDADDLEWWSRFGAWVLIAATAWLVASAIVFAGPTLVERARRAVEQLLNMSGSPGSALIGLAAPVMGALGAWLARPSSERETSPTRTIALALAVPAFVVLLVATLAWADDRVLHRMSAAPVFQRIETRFGTRLCGSEEEIQRASRARCHPPGAGFAEVFSLGLGLLIVGITMGRMIPANKFSLNGMYRQRLTRAFLGASRATRQANPFTGFDPRDDIPFDDLESVRPLHVVNATLNALARTSLGRQDCKADAFTISPLHAGSASLGYRPTGRFAADPITGRGISLGTAITISGAAASPSMGMYSTSARTFLLTLLNARLGAWMGNPGKVGSSTWANAEPAPGAMLVLHELLGRTDEDSPYVYLSDGGHFDNLGLVEMVRRRCRFIVVVDAAADPDYAFGDLANAVRRIRIDLGVRVELDAMDIDRTHVGSGNPHCLVGKIHYGQVDGDLAVGTLVYLKPTLSGDEPADVRNYAVARPTFPHESTANQWFTEAQFESYRMLGTHSVESIVGGDGPRPLEGGVPAFCDAARAYSGPHQVTSLAAPA